MSASSISRADDDFREFAKRLNAIADKHLRREIYEGLREIARPLGEAMAESGAAAMPRRGGLSGRLRSVNIGTLNSTTGANPGIVLTLRQRDGYNLPDLDDGNLHHPTFGRPPWRTQAVPSGAYNRAFVAGLPAMQINLRRHLDAALAKGA